jgi:hypothetical protein
VLNGNGIKREKQNEVVIMDAETKVIREMKDPYIEIAYTLKKSDKFPVEETYVKVVMPVGVANTTPEADALKLSIETKLAVIKAVVNKK